MLLRKCLVKARCSFGETWHSSCSGAGRACKASSCMAHPLNTRSLANAGHHAIKNSRPVPNSPAQVPARPLECRGAAGSLPGRPTAIEDGKSTAWSVRKVALPHLASRLQHCRNRVIKLPDAHHAPAGGFGMAGCVASGLKQTFVSRQPWDEIIAHISYEGKLLTTLQLQLLYLLQNGVQLGLILAASWLLVALFGGSSRQC